MKNNKNLIFSVLFLVLANIMLFIDPFKEMSYMIVFVAVFLVCSAYTGIRFMVKGPSDNKLFKIIPKSFLGFLAVLLVITCLAYFKMIIVGFVAVLS